MSRLDSKVNRKRVFAEGAVVAAGGATLGSAALSYSRIAGANDRISLGHIGIGNRGRELDGIVAVAQRQKKCGNDGRLRLVSHNLEQAVASNQKYYGKAPRGSSIRRHCWRSRM